MNPALATAIKVKTVPGTNFPLPEVVPPVVAAAALPLELIPLACAVPVTDAAETPLPCAIPLVTKVEPAALPLVDPPPAPAETSELAFGATAEDVSPVAPPVTGVAFTTGDCELITAVAKLTMGVVCGAGAGESAGLGGIVVTRFCVNSVGCGMLWA